MIVRVALLSTLASIADGTPRAFLALGGRPLIAWQIDLALALGCERLLCLAEGGGDTADRVNREAARAGLEVEFLGGPRHLLGKITADQDLVVIADGLLFDPELAREHFANRRGVAAISDYPGVEKGFERIDPELAWAGLLVARGSIGEQLSQMPADGDTMSLLLRMALQSGTRTVRLDELHLGTGDILLGRGASDLAERERALLDNSTAKVTWTGLGEKLASRAARALAPQHLERGPAMALALGLLLLAGALGASYFELVMPALGALVLGSFSISLSQALRHLRARLHGRLTNRRFNMTINGLVDTAIIGVLAIGNLPDAVIDVVFEPVLLVGLWRLAAALSRPAIRPFWRDRTSLSIILLVLAGVGILPQVIPVMVLILVFYALISEASDRLTRA